MNNSANYTKKSMGSFIMQEYAEKRKAKFGYTNTNNDNLWERSVCIITILRLLKFNKLSEKIKTGNEHINFKKKLGVFLRKKGDYSFTDAFCDECLGTVSISCFLYMFCFIYVKPLCLFTHNVWTNFQI